jgi:CheY-like chemotaxis protein
LSAAPVLVIDDDPAAAATTLAWLAGVRYPIVAEPDGDAVLRLARAGGLRLVVADSTSRAPRGRAW